MSPARRPPAAGRDWARTGAPARRRLSHAQREEEIVREAVGFFAEFGFEGQTRELAKRLNITQPLLYRYFPTKDALVERVYQEVFLRRWNPFWEETIRDPSRPLRERLIAFYTDYATAILTYEWIRLFMFAGLKGLDFNTRYLDLLRERVFALIVAQLRDEFGRPPLAERPVTAPEVEAIWSLHAGIFYLGVRKFVYNMPVDDVSAIVAMKVRLFLDGARTVIGVEETAPPASLQRRDR
ncbi:TetR/AcrR family transcriptional regulator [Methylobacterium nonmethylotrophicum]|uniref:TetR/AcrR family transcriptional regulator n=1 Tax=Methylobacterium nonmethylotrophicum TaxID=1141884 RepID=A0A4Z0NUR6_9HYPH|nr:TetR/AcrR family transcriptional regulator [Methylobacterium nonmethylotrophicum]TGE01255.1 TetR/AcrR family transcriptional regulator [Methylobacterium nonmethylotrophicum]